MSWSEVTLPCVHPSRLVLYVASCNSYDLTPRAAHAYIRPFTSCFITRLAAYAPSFALRLRLVTCHLLYTWLDNGNNDISVSCTQTQARGKLGIRPIVFPVSAGTVFSTCFKICLQCTSSLAPSILVELQWLMSREVYILSCPLGLFTSPFCPPRLVSE